MMRSLFSGVSGLRVHQTKMDVIANNIANVNTVGYKASRVTFNEVFYQRIQGASSPSEGTGRAGTNPMQIGLGASVASIDVLMTQGASQRTDNALDLMIQGAGFFIVSDGSGTYFTRAGNFIQDQNNNLAMNGLRLMGWDTMIDPTTGKEVIASGPVKPISITGDKAYVPPASTSIVDMIGNLNAREDPVITRSMEFYDSVGNLYTVDVVFRYHPETSTNGALKPPSDHANSYWSFEYVGDAKGVRAYPKNDRTDVKHLDPATLLGGILNFDNQGQLQAYAAITKPSIQPSAGATATPPYIGGQSAPVPYTSTSPYWNKVADDVSANRPPRLSLDIKQVEVLDPTAYLGIVDFEALTPADTPPYKGQIFIDLSQLTQFVGQSTNVKYLPANGNEPGVLEDLSVGPDGMITGRYSNGQKKLLGQIPLAKFINPAGLEKIGNNLYVTSPNSGAFDGVGEIGSLLGGVLEMSNVDLSSEFTEMITTQRGFQANSRIITTSDELLQELVNLKR